MMAPVSVSLGVVLSLPAKLGQLLSPEAHHGLRKGERNKIRLLKDQLQELIDKYLIEPSELEVPTSTARCWVKEVRELSYDIDDFLDELIDRLHGSRAAATNQNNLQGKVARLREGLMRSRCVADETSRFRARLEEAIQRHKRYNLDNLQKRLNTIDTEDEDEPPIRVKAARLVGIDGSMKKLEEWLTGDDEQRLRVVSIVGFAGIGKTTLAKELYRKLGWQFECRAFARSSHKPDIRSLLANILLQIRRHQLPNDLELANLIDTIRAYLQDKKYFIIIDDLWDASQWDIINRALPDDKYCSRVLTTTEIDILAQRCCGHSSKHIFNMQPLCDKGSSELFFSKFLVNQSENCEEFNKVLSKIIRKCGGFPLATIATASILGRQQDKLQHCNYISRSLSSDLRTNPTIEGMKQVLSLCYDNLPGRLKPCLLYLSIYKQGHIFWKYDLVKQWITEGFICAKRGNHLEEIAGSYFDELLNGGMIESVHINKSGDVLSCTVHYMVLNILRYKSMEENFVIAIDHSQTNTMLADKVRRLSLHFGDVDDAESPSKLRLSQVRSLVFFGSFKALPSIVEFRLLRVLILHLWGDRDNISLDLTTVCRFFRLRNLIIACNVTLNLQIQLRGLEYLETLKIDSRVCEVPQDIVLLPRLLHLSLPADLSLPNGIGRLASLRTLGCFDLTKNSADVVQSLGELNNIHDLHLTCSTMPCHRLEENVGCLASVLSKLSHLKTLKLSPGVSNANTTVVASSNILLDCLSTVSSPPALLEKLDFSRRICLFSKLPRWLLEVGKLTVLKIAVRELWQSDIYILNRLNHLSALSLYVRTALAERIVFHELGFTLVNYFKFVCPAPWLSFKQECMPNVRRLKLGFSAKALEQCSLLDAGLENLTSLEVFTVNVRGVGSDESARKAVQTALEVILSQRGSLPITNVKLVNRTFYGDKEMSIVAQTELGQILEKTNVLTKGQSGEQYTIEETGSTEKYRIRGESRRIPLSLESSSLAENPGMSALRASSSATSAMQSAPRIFMPSTVDGQILEIPNLKIYTFAELKSATKNFGPDTVLGVGRFGKVYKGWVDANTLNPLKSTTRMVAVKKLNRESMMGIMDWQSEINFLGRISHPNLVKLLGFCMEDSEVILVYEFMSKGSLEDHLFGRVTVHEELPWSRRLKILIDAGCGLAFLHSAGKQIFYSDFKPSNILLDSKFNAKLSDFGLTKHWPDSGESHATGRAIGTSVYAAPELVSTGRLSAKSDVYGFGVVLLEMMTGMKALDRSRQSHQINLVDWAKPLLAGRRKFDQVIDVRLQELFGSKAARLAAQLTLECLNGDPTSRPHMDEVVDTLKTILKVTTGPRGAEQRRRRRRRRKSSPVHGPDKFGCRPAPNPERNRRASVTHDVMVSGFNPRKTIMPAGSWMEYQKPVIPVQNRIKKSRSPMSHLRRRWLARSAESA